MKQVVRKLNTKEDPHHVHKVFGILCLLNFVFRYAWMWPTTGSLGYSSPAKQSFLSETMMRTVNDATILAHFGLSASSMIFKVLPKRIHKKPAIIWNEYRLHAIVFTLRCVSLYYFSTYCPLFAPPSTNGINTSRKNQWQGRIVQLALVLSHHVVVDYISRVWGKEGETTVRGRHEKQLKPRIVILTKAYSLYQFVAIASHIVPNERTADLAFNGLIAIQSSAFLMTLYRKGLIAWYHHAFAYGTCLLLSSAYILQCASRPLWFVSAILIVGYFRIRHRVSKYVLWPSFSFFANAWGDLF